MHTFKEIKEAKLLADKREKRAQRLLNISARTNQTEKEILAEVKRINGKGIYKINLAVYSKWDLYFRSEADLDQMLHLFGERRLLKDAVLEKKKKIDAGELSYDCLREETEACHALNRQLISESMVEKFAPQVAAVKPDLLDNHDLLKETIVDMETMFFLHDYTYEEYVAFRFMEKSIEERMTFLSGAERRKVLIAINDEEANDLFHDKHACYLKFKRYFRRRQACVYEDADFPEFQRFCRKSPAFVKKPLVAHKGKGVEPVYTEKGTDCRALMTKLLEENGPFVVEEMIQTHDALKAMNPDSVNTVRVETYFDGRDAYISNAFFRVGKAGFFVDNGSAGGIIVPIDLGTGKLTETGRDKTNITYKVHPDTGITFAGYQIPYWKQLIKLSKKLASMHPAVKYVGWDLTLNHRGKWVVVEGNARPGGFGVQRSSGIGTRADFFRVIQKNPNDFR
ncbi:MAG: hypothetical protein IKJ77_06655 [Firmicutes bacterium]|nr:hypothetical protein [Bacillota bacterium]